MVNNKIIHMNVHRRNVKLAYTENGNVKYKCSVGFTKYKNTRKTSAFAFQEVATIFAKKLESMDVKNVYNIKITGIGQNSLPVLKTIAQYINSEYIENITPYRHGGCKPKRQVRK